MTETVKLLCPTCRSPLVLREDQRECPTCRRFIDRPPVTRLPTALLTRLHPDWLTVWMCPWCDWSLAQDYGDSEGYAEIEEVLADHMAEDHNLSYGEAVERLTRDGGTRDV